MICASLALLLALPCYAQGVDFGQDFGTALRAAKKSGNPVLVDAYTTWCKPCKTLDAEVFVREDVGTIIAERFEAVKLNMEAEGRPVAQRYGITSYPTLLVVDSDGNEIDRLVGYVGVLRTRAWLKHIKGVPAEGSFAMLQRDFERGRRDTASLRRLVELGAGMLHPETGLYAAALLDARADWSSPDAHDLVMQHVTVASSLFDTLVAHQAAFAKTQGDYVVDERIALELDRALFGNTPVKKHAAKRLIARAYPTAVDSTFLRYRMRVAREAGDAKKFGKLAIRWQRDFPTDDADELSELVYVFEERLAGWKTDEVAAWKAREEELRAAEGSW